MTQRYWVPAAVVEWASFDADEWSTFLLEPAGISGAGLLFAGSGSISGVATAERVGQGNLIATGGQIAGVGEVHHVAVAGGGALVARPGTIAGVARRDPTAHGVLVSGPATVAGVASRGLTAAGNLVARPATTSTVTGSHTAQGNLAASPATLAGEAKAVTFITGAGVLVAGEASLFSSGLRELIATPSIIEGVYVPQSSADAVRSGVDVLALSPPSLALGRVTGECAVWSVKRTLGEIELFYDDVERELVLGGGCPGR